VAHSAIRDTAREIGLVPICVNSAWNHTHSLLSWNPSVSIEEAAAAMQSESEERWNQLRSNETLDEPELQWQEGWAAFSVSPTKVEEAKRYVADQKDRHRTGRIINRYESLKGECASDDVSSGEETHKTTPQPAHHSQNNDPKS
jgi:REP element-mobilizing transposase RayT